ncbi:kinase-like domain-containing protein, partial [Amanita rubescens]
GGFGRVFRGEHEGRQNTLIKAIRREALTWRSLSHRFILPLLGIYEEKLQLSLVSPLMENGTLAKWREQCTPDIAKVHRAMLEVAEGVQHLHSEGVVHGDLHGVRT